MDFFDHITFENIEQYAATNALTVKNPKGLVTQFHGLYDGCFGLQDEGFAKRCDDHNMLYLYPYGGAWNWMSEATRKMTDRCIDVLFEHFNLPKSTPVISTGHSMGGNGALIFTLNSVHNIVACAANCPVCDIEAFISSSESLPRTVAHALGAYEGSYEEVLKGNSPLYRVDDMPDIPYYIVHGADDGDVFVNENSDPTVEKMKQAGKNVTYDRVPGMGHVAMPEESTEKYFEFIFSILR